MFVKQRVWDDIALAIVTLASIYLSAVCLFVALFMMRGPEECSRVTTIDMIIPSKQIVCLFKETGND